MRLQNKHIMRATKYINSKGCPKGAFVYMLKKDGTRYASPMFIKFIGDEKTAVEVAMRLGRLNPDSKFVAE